MARKHNKARKQLNQNNTSRGKAHPQPPTKSAKKTQTPINQTLTNEEEKKASSLAYVLFFVLTEYFSPAVRSFLNKHQLLATPLRQNYDLAKLIYLIVDELESG